MGQMGVGGGPSAKRRHGGCGVAPGKTAGMGGYPAPPLLPVSCRYLLVNCCSFFFSLTEEANSGQIWRSGQTRVLETGWAWSVDVAPAISIFTGEATLLHSSGVKPCACSELWWNYLALT